MTRTHKPRTLLAIVECVPAAQAMTVFESAARRGDLSAFWNYYQDVFREEETGREPEGCIERRGLLGDDRAGHAGRV